VIDATGMIVVPGLVDVHIHASGGGGEAGPMSRTPEAQLDDLILGGVTTFVGLLGTDGTTRSEINLLSKLKGLSDEGLTTFMWSGSYQLPLATLTGSLESDLIVIDKVIGAGEIALSDHRSSVPTYEELTKIVSLCRDGGLLSGKAGKAYFHLGSGKQKIDLLWQIVTETDIPITQIYPTHMSRTGGLSDEGANWILKGGYIDMTADGDDTANNTIKTLLSYKSKQIPLDHVSISSDAYGSKPKFDSKGNLIAYTYVKPIVLLNELRRLIQIYGFSIAEAFGLMTRTPGKFLSLNKGELIEGRDADILILDKATLTLQYVISKGEILKTPTWIKPPFVPVCQ